MPAGIYVRSSDYLVAAGSANDPGDGGQFSSRLDNSACSTLRRSTPSDALIRVPSFPNLDADTKALLLHAAEQGDIYDTAVRVLCK
jgi:hypothetical protein